MSIGHQQRVVVAHRPALKRDLPRPIAVPDGMLDCGIESDLIAEPEMIDVGIEVGGNVRVMRVERYSLGHGKVRIGHAWAGAIDVQRAIRRGQTVLVPKHPQPADAVALFVAVERDTTVLQRLSRGDSG